MTHHLVISKAGGATVQEAIAARCPMIVNQVIPGQEEGNARLIWRIWPRRGCGKKPRSRRTGRGSLCQQARASGRNGAKISTKSASPDAARAHRRTGPRRMRTRPTRAQSRSNCLNPRRRASCVPRRCKRPTAPAQRRCCSAIFTSTPIIPTANLSVPEVVDFYGERGFDCICITDHLADPKRLDRQTRRACATSRSAQEQFGRIFRRHRARTPARVAEIQHARHDRHRVQQGRLHAKNLRASARH